MVAINVLKGGGSLLRSCGGGGRPLVPTHCRRFSGNGNRVGKWEMTVGGSPLHLSPNSISLPNNTKSRSTETASASRVFCCTAFQNAAVDSSSSSPLPETPSSSPSESDDHLVMIKNAVNTLDIRVGRIVRAWRHEEADSLYVEEVDIGEPQPRIICSGLVNYIPLDHLQDKMIVVLANLKPRNMRGVKSFGMLMAASDASHKNIELLVPPEGSFPGERIWFGSTEEKENLPDTATPNQIQKKKVWELVQPHLKTDTSCVAALGMHFMRTSAGVVTCRSLKNAMIS